MDEPRIIEDVLAELRAQPGIDIGRQPAGTTVLIETTQGVIEMEVLNPATGLVRVSGTDPKIKEPKVCQFLQSDYDLKGLLCLPKWIGKELRMKLAFANATFHCSATVSAAVRLKAGSYYNVF